MLKILPNKALVRKIEPFLLPAIVALVGLTAFGLGRLSTAGEQGPRLVITMPPGSQAASVIEASVIDEPQARQSEQRVGETGKYVASKSGSKYYLPSCPGVERIKQENRVYFATIAEAQAAGYTPAANCPGL